MKIRWDKLILSWGITLGAGAAGSVFTAPAIEGWYKTLNKPFFNPPNQIFAPVWTGLYILMGIAFYLILTADDKKQEKKQATEWYGIQLGLNLLWSIIFFGLQNPGAALIEILALWTAIWLTMRRFLDIYQPAALLLVPYIMWVSFAALLNLSIVLLN